MQLKFAGSCKLTKGDW